MQFPLWKKTLVILVCAAALLIALPNALGPDARKSMAWLPAGTVNLGLDLRGGSYLLLEVDAGTYIREQLEQLTDDVRLRLREKKIGYVSLSPHAEMRDGTVSGGRVSFQLRDVAQAEAAEEALAGFSRDIAVSVDGNSGMVSLSYSGSAMEGMLRAVMEQSIEIVRRRVDETGTREPEIQRQGDRRILLQVPGLESPEQLKRLLGRTAKMTFHLMHDAPFSDQPVRNPPPGIMALPDNDPAEKRFYLVKKKVELSGDMLVDSAATFDDKGRPVVSFRFNSAGGRKFAAITKENVGKPFAVVLDGKVITAPVIRSPIPGGSGIIEGNFSVQGANDLALLLRAGALPAPLRILEERSVGPSLGQDSIISGKRAAMAGAALVVTVMVLFYGLFGLFASLALAVNMIMVIAALSLFQATLTLPGIAGLVLTMGMAVDANVLIFERIRDEIRIGKTPFAAIDHGFKNAFSSIFDSNLTTLISTFLLYVYGSGPVKGFAVTLSAGVLCSMFSAILLTRLMAVAWVTRVKPKTLPL